MTRVDDEILKPSKSKSANFRSGSMMSAESCSKWLPESPRYHTPYLSNWGADDFDKDLLPEHDIEPLVKIGVPSADVSPNFKGRNSSKLLDSPPVMVSYQKTPDKLMKGKLGYPKPDHGLLVAPYPNVPHPSHWSTKHRSVYVQQVVAEFPLRPKELPRLNAIEAPLSQTIEIDNTLFKGVAMIRIKGLNQQADSEYFSGKRRKHQLIVQGTFKSRYRADEIWGGQIFQHAWQNMPSAWVTRASLSTAKLINPAMSERLTSKKNPFVLFPWISMPQKIHITPKGESPPDIHGSDGIEEDCSLLGPQFLKKESFFRRKYFTDYTKLKGIHYEEDLVYTFEDYQDAFDFNSFTLNLKLSGLDIALRLHDMPLEMGVMKFQPSNLKKDTVENEFEELTSVPYLWRFQLWPKQCVLHKFYMESDSSKKTENSSSAKSKYSKTASFGLKSGKG